MITRDECKKLMINQDKLNKAIEEIDSGIREMVGDLGYYYTWNVPSGMSYYTAKCIADYLIKQGFHVEMPLGAPKFITIYW